MCGIAGIYLTDREAAVDTRLYSSPDDIDCDALYVIKAGSPSRVTRTLPELKD